MNSQAIVILFSGPKPKKETINQIYNAVIDSGVIPEMIDIRHVETQDIANAVTVAVITPNSDCEQKEETKKPVEIALWWMVENFKDCVKINGNAHVYVKFMTQFQKELYDALANASVVGLDRLSEHDRALINAAEIISKERNSITDEIRKRVGISKVAIQLIISIYENVLASRV